MQRIRRIEARREQVTSKLDREWAREVLALYDLLGGNASQLGRLFGITPRGASKRVDRARRLLDVPAGRIPDQSPVSSEG